MLYLGFSMVVLPPIHHFVGKNLGMSLNLRSCADGDPEQHLPPSRAAR